MLTPEEQAALDKAAEFVLALKGKGLTSDEAMTMTVKLLEIFIHSAQGMAAMQHAMTRRLTRETS